MDYTLLDNFLILIISFVILVKSADFFVDGAVGVAKSFNLPKMLIGIVLVGFGTTAPEFAVSVYSSAIGRPEIALGNGIGSVICDDAIALALAAVIAPVIINRRLFKTVIPALICFGASAYIMSLDGTISRFEGVVLLTILIGYFYYLYRNQKKHNNQEHNGEDIFNGTKSSSKKSILLFIAGLVGVVVSSKLVVNSGINIAQAFKVPEIVIGLTVIAIGTSLPEISTCIIAACKKESEIAAGDIIGADILNIAWIIGVASVVNPITVEQRIINFSFPFMFLVVATMLIAMRSGYKVTRKEGLVLVSLYLVYIFFTIMILGPKAAIAGAF